MSYKHALENLLSLEFFGMKLGLRNIEELLEFLGRPDRKLQTIHVAGTNGKGSVCATLAAYYQTKGLKTGLYTSPHLVDYRERIRINGEMIAEDFIESFVERCWPKVAELNATFFEVTTALAFEYFASQQVDIAIIETGLGGRLDATNILEKPQATVITSIAMDHMLQLGSTIEQIAAEKAGIIKPGVPAIVNVDGPVRQIFVDRCNSLHAPSIEPSEYRLPEWVGGIRPSLQGSHQQENLRTALVTLDVLRDLDGPTAIAAIPNVAKLTGLRARWEEAVIEWDGKRITRILDVGHNEAAMREIAGELGRRGGKVTLLAGFMADKDVRSALLLLKPFVEFFFAVQPAGKRSMNSEQLAAIGSEIGMKSVDAGRVIEGYRCAMSEMPEGGRLLVVGSHYLVGELLANEKTPSGVV